MPVTMRGVSAPATQSESRPARIGARLRTALRQPLVQFILLGVLLSAAAHQWQARHDRHVIYLSAEAKERIAAHYQQQFGGRPDEATLALLVQQYVRDEIFLREALALHLDQNDEIVRRRLVQKFEFLQTEETIEAAPSDAELGPWFAAHHAQYEAPASVAFTHEYFSPDHGGERAAEQRAKAALGELNGRTTGRGGARGDPFPGPSAAGDLSPREAQRLFGESELTERLFSVPVGTWSGPYRSGYGWHLLYVSGHQPATVANLADIRATVLADYMTERRQRAAERAYDELRSQYVIHEAP